MTHTKAECDKGEKIDRIEKALFFGNGKPAITSQLEVMNARFDTVEKKIDGALSIGKSIVVGVLMMVIANVYQIVINYNQQKDGNHVTSTK